MRSYTIDCSKLHSFTSAYAELERVFGFPHYFGRNLDALEECLGDLTSELGPITVKLENCTSPAMRFSGWENIHQVLQSNQDITIIRSGDD